MWGILGGVLGVVVGGGSAAIGIFIEGADPLGPTSPYPSFFTKRQLLVYDYFLLSMIVLGTVIAITGVVLSRRSRFPRTDTLGALLACGGVAAPWRRAPVHTPRRGDTRRLSAR
jgi:hypothetical protein